MSVDRLILSASWVGICRITVFFSVSTTVTLAAGDLIYSGTPAGVGPLLRGDLIEAEVAGVAQLRVRMV